MDSGNNESNEEDFANDDDDFSNSEDNSDAGDNNEEWLDDDLCFDENAEDSGKDHSMVVSYYLEFIGGSTLSYVCNQKNEIRFLAFVAQKLILGHQSKPYLNLLMM